MEGEETRLDLQGHSIILQTTSLLPVITVGADYYKGYANLHLYNTTTSKDVGFIIGVEAGGRTGLAALTTGIIFLACMFIAPIAALIPAAATSSALIYVGILMLQGLSKIDFSDIATAAPVFIMLITMPISSSIGHGIGLGLISYSIIKVLTGKAKDVSVLTWIISIIFIIKFFIPFK